MYDVWIGFVPLIMLAIFEKADLTGLTELYYRRYTCLRLLLRLQLSNPRLERGSLGVTFMGRFCGTMVGVLSIVLLGNDGNLRSMVW